MNFYTGDILQNYVEHVQVELEAENNPTRKTAYIYGNISPIRREKYEKQLIV
jgi:hypothetical protein